ncbi:MAG: DUF3144 domain-containing protein [Halopseudomonas sp.]
MKDVDKGFYQRADAHIFLSNDQMAPELKPGEVSASMMFAVARFNAWISASGFNSGTEMTDAKDKMMDYFINEYKMMLSENLDDYIENFDDYMKPAEQQN